MEIFEEVKVIVGIGIESVGEVGVGIKVLMF